MYSLYAENRISMYNLESRIAQLAVAGGLRDMYLCAIVCIHSRSKQTGQVFERGLVHKYEYALADQFVRTEKQTDL